ncbi:MAG: hypothetical protein JNM75_00665 [Rhodospirillales bacterium]|nr:hypothetical protein [Rhodospirillales bacterium]
MSDYMNFVMRWQIQWLIASMTISKQLFDLFPGEARRSVQSIFPAMDLKKAGCVGPADLKA